MKLEIDANTIIAFFTAVSCFIMSVQTCTLLISLIFVAQQIEVARKEQRLGAVWEIFSQLDSDKIMAAREFVYDNREAYLSLEGHDEKYKKLTKEARTNAELVSSSFSRVGYAVSHDLIPENIILDGYRFMVTRCWHILGPYNRAVRFERKNDYYQKFFEELAQRACLHYHMTEEERTYTVAPHH